MSDDFKHFLLTFALPLFVILLAVSQWLFHSWLPGISGVIFGVISCITIYFVDQDARKQQ